MDFDEEEDLYFLNLMMVVTMIGVVLIKKKQNSIRRTRRPYQAIYLQRNLVGAHQRLLENNLVSYMEFVRMDKNTFYWLLNLVRPKIEVVRMVNIIQMHMLLPKIN